MTETQFINHKNENPQITFHKIGEKLLSIKKRNPCEYGIYNIYRRDFYSKSNRRKCYVDTFIKEVNANKIENWEGFYGIKDELIQTLLNK